MMLFWLCLQLCQMSGHKHRAHGEGVKEEKSDNSFKLITSPD